MRHILFISLVLLLCGSTAFAAEVPVPKSMQEKFLATAKKIWASLDRQRGKIALPNDVATLNVPESFYYLNPKQSAKILVDVWGNPPETGQNILGMLFPSDTTPFDDGAWGVTIEYEEEGYVSDEDADEIDYEELLIQMKESTREASEAQVAQGYEPVQLIGWASKPFYDQQSHKLHWAKEIKFGDQLVNTLYYNIRVLGRKGVLILNFIADMDQKPTIDANIDAVLAMAEFNEGSRYEDFDSSVDEVAAYGLGALIAGKILAKTGLLAAALIFLKKFGIYIVVAGGALLAKIFKRKKEDEPGTPVE